MSDGKIYVPMYKYSEEEGAPAISDSNITALTPLNAKIYNKETKEWVDADFVYATPENGILEDYEVTENLAQIETFEKIMKRLVSLSTRQLNVIFGLNTLAKVVTYLTYEEIIKKLNEFDTNPKVGEIWQRPITGVRALIVGVKENSISVIVVGKNNDDNNVEELSRENFFEIYVNTGEKSKYYNALINEIK